MPHGFLLQIRLYVCQVARIADFTIIKMKSFQTHITFIWRGYVYTYKYINIYNKITQVDSTCGYVGRLFRKSPRIYRSASVYIFLYMYISVGCSSLRTCVYVCACVCVCVYVCVTVFSLAECWLPRKTGSQMFNRPRGVITVAPHGIIEETLMYIANYQKWQNSSYVRSSGSTYTYLVGQ